ncbi:hypothetical protein V2G26_015484 [Clonostachys chloroleuca]
MSFWTEAATQPGPTAGICATVILIYGVLKYTSRTQGRLLNIYLAAIWVGSRDSFIPLDCCAHHLNYRFDAFFILGALAVGIVVPYNGDVLKAVWLSAGSGKGTAAASPYVISMENLGISVLPHIVNALILTSIFSAGNTYMYCASRALYSLFLDGHAPRILSYCTSKGVPIYCFAIVMLFSFLSFLQAHSGSAVVLTWLVDLVWERPGIDGYEDANTEPPLGFWEEMIHIFGFPKKKGMSDA